MTPWQLAISCLLAVASLPLLLWWGLWVLFTLLACIPSRRFYVPAFDASTQSAHSIDILIPAHNEELLLPNLLQSLQTQTAKSDIDRILVVADHCTDTTALIARQFGAQVLERNSGPHGKPAVLRDGIALLSAPVSTSPDRRALLILDADCTVPPDLVARASAALQNGAAVLQAPYILESNTPAPTPFRTAALIAFALKNQIRPRGMAHLGIPTQLFGTGMFFRADLLSQIHFSDHLTEDLVLSQQLLLQGINPRFLDGLPVRSPLPAERRAMSVQKLRWEAGQLHTWSILPAMLISLLVRGRLRAAIALLDWSAPPLAMAVIYALGVVFAVGMSVAWRWASPWILCLPLLSIACLAGYVLVGGFQISGAAAVGRLFLAAPRFLFWKLSLYLQMSIGRGAHQWQRTPRTGAEMK